MRRSFFSCGLAAVLLAALTHTPASAQFVPNDEYYDTEGVYAGTSSAGQWYLHQIDMSRAWEIVTVDPSLIVAVIDLGLDISHPEISGNLWTNPTVGLPGGEIPDNDIDDDNNGCRDDVHGCNFGNLAGPDGSESVLGGGHGTNVTGIIAASGDDHDGIASPAGGLSDSPGVRIMTLSYQNNTGPISRQQVAEAIEYAVDRGAKIINFSIGFHTNDPAIEDAVEYAAQNGVLMIAARGNAPGFNPEPCESGQTDCPATGSSGPLYPASYDEVMKVGATDVNGEYWEGNILLGGVADIFAPGGEATILTLADIGGPSQEPEDGYTETFGGTSASTPVVTGVAALVWSLNPGLTAVQVDSVLVESADPNGCTNNGNPCDAGRVDAYAALVYTLENYGGTLTQDLTIPAGETWDFQDVTVEFAPGTKLIVQGDLNTDGTTFTASDGSQGWDGITFTSTSTSVLLGTTVEKVTSGSSLTVINADVKVASGSIVRGEAGANTSGITVSGPSANVEVEGASLVENHDLYGIVASGGLVVVKDNSDIARNGTGGVRSTGSSSEVRLKQADVIDNTGSGAIADAGGFVDIRGAFTSEVTGNFGGLDADYFSQIDGGMCSGSTCPHEIHDLSENTQNGTYFDARALESSSVIAEGNFWAQPSVSSLILIEDATSVISVEPLSLTPALTGDRRAANATASAKGPGGDLLLDVRGLTLEALRRYDASEMEDGSRDPVELEAADAALASAFQQATTAEEHARAFGTAAWLLAREPLPVSSAWVESHAALSGARRPWVLRALLSARSGQERTADARTVAATLASDYAGTEHETMALLEGVRLAVEAGDGTVAATHLATLEALAAEPSTGGDRTTERRADAVEIARLFMGLPLSGASSAGARLRGEPSAAKTTAVSEPALSLPVPNPSRARTALTLSLPYEAHIQAEVLDLLGRPLMVLADEVLADGRTTLEVDTSRLAAGVYVVRVLVDGAQSTRLARRLTVVR